jgi:NADPH:quinone reductase-like Zn-dependent oxidoreductase
VWATQGLLCDESNPIIRTASSQNTDLLLSLGATHVIDRKLAAAVMEEQVTRIVGTPIPYIFRFYAVCVEETQQAAYDLLLVAPGGALALVIQKSVKEDETS